MHIDRIWTLLQAIRERRPRVHSITNLVAINSSANTLLALGASPAMAHSSDEVEDFVAHSQALVINIGTLFSEQVAACKLAVARAKQVGVPWVLDPVGAGAASYRRAAANALVQRGPQVIRGNASEILALIPQAGANSSLSGGVDSLHAAEAVLELARKLAGDTQAVVAITGTVDYVTDGTRIAAIQNGHPLMARVTGLGCAATAVIGAFMTVEPDALMATVAALVVFGVAGEIAAERARGPGSLQVELLDALYGLDATTLRARARMSDELG